MTGSPLAGQIAGLLLVGLANGKWLGTADGYGLCNGHFVKATQATTLNAVDAGADGVEIHNSTYYGRGAQAYTDYPTLAEKAVA